MKLFGFLVDVENLILVLCGFVEGLDEVNVTALVIGGGSFVLIFGLCVVVLWVLGVFFVVVFVMVVVVVFGFVDDIFVVGDVLVGLSVFGVFDVVFEDFKMLFFVVVGIVFVVFIDMSILLCSYVVWFG